MKLLGEVENITNSVVVSKIDKPTDWKVGNYWFSGGLP